MQIIDYSGPWEVFGQAGFKVFTVADKSEPLITRFDQRVIADYTFDNSPDADILLLPGGRGTLKAADDAGIYGIGVDKDQYNDAKRVLTSGVKRVDVGVFDVRLMPTRMTSASFNASVS